MILRFSEDELQRLRAQLEQEGRELADLTMRVEATLSQLEVGWSGRVPTGMSLAIDSLRSKRAALAEYADNLSHLSSYVHETLLAIQEVSSQLDG